MHLFAEGDNARKGDIMGLDQLSKAGSAGRLGLGSVDELVGQRTLLKIREILSLNFVSTNQRSSESFRQMHHCEADELICSSCH